MKRLIILCLTLITFVVVAEDKVMEQQGKWSIIRQDNWPTPVYIISVEEIDSQIKLMCMTSYKRIILNFYYFNTKNLDNVVLSSKLMIFTNSNNRKNDLLGKIYNYSSNAVNWGIYFDYNLKNQKGNKIKSADTFSLVFKQFLTASGDITFTAQGEGDTVYQATINSDGLPTIFNHFAQYCGPDFIEAFDLAMDEK